MGGSTMFETPFAVVGNIVTDPIHRQVGEQEMVRVRGASNSRRRTAEGTWEPGNSLFVTVTCWGRVVAGASAALVKGDPVIVVGHIHTSEYDDRDGNRRSSVEVRATSVGPDLARSTASVDRLRNTAANSDDAAEDKDDEAESESGSVETDESP